jgi:hypothetical protein
VRVTTWPARRMEFEQLQLTRRQLDLAATTGHPPREEIEVEVSHLELRGIRRIRAPAGERFDARQELHERKRLRQIVVAARFQAFHPIVHATQGAEHQHGCRDAFLAHDLDDGESVDMRQHPVGDDQIELPFRGPEQAIPAVRGVIDRVAALSQSFDEEPRGLGVVLDEKYVHGVRRLPPARAGLTRQRNGSAIGQAIAARGARLARLQASNERSQEHAIEA